MTTRVHLRFLVAGVIGLACTIGIAAPSRAQGFVSPLIGFDFGGDASCPTIDNCRNKRLNAGIGLGVLGNVFGFEEEFAYAQDFFGQAPNLKSSALTLMTSAMLAPKIGPVRPYVLAGVGLVKTHVEFTPSAILASDNNNFGWDLGGGLMITVAPHVALRGDIRYFHSFQDMSILGFTVNNPKLDFGRAAAALNFTF